MCFLSPARTTRVYIYLRGKKKKSKAQIQVSESRSPFMCNYQCISTGCAIIFIVTFIHVMPLLIWFRYELLTVTVLVVRGEAGGGGEKSSTSQAAKPRQLEQHREPPSTSDRLRKAEASHPPVLNFHHFPQLEKNY